jgi:hypothetical protein
VGCVCDVPNTSLVGETPLFFKGLHCLSSGNCLGLGTTQHWIKSHGHCHQSVQKVDCDLSLASEMLPIGI